MSDVLLATCAQWPHGEPGGEHLLAAFAERGVAASWAAWDDPGVDWSAASLVAMRSTWDYVRRREELLAWADHVARWSRLLHGPGVVRWNTDKAYLLDLAAGGVPVVPTRLLDDPAGLAVAATGLPGRVLVKPRVGAGGDGIVVLDRGPSLGVDLAGLLDAAQGPWVVQPVVESVRTEGETSVFVLAGAAVSQVRKLPGGDEVRVHEHHGGSTEVVDVGKEHAALALGAVAAAERLLGEPLTYARADLMRLDDGTLAVGELELVEPGLSLDVLPANADAFAGAVVAVL